jgi:ubiquitin C-terminal hydrolase
MNTDIFTNEANFSQKSQKEDNIEIKDNKEKEIIYGCSKFRNIMGITCYMNSIIHILQQLPIFVEYISQAKFRDIIMTKITKQTNNDSEKENLVKNYVIFELFRLFKISLENENSNITPSTFKTLIGKKNSMWNELNHQDSQEFFNFLISKIEEEAGIKTTFIPGLLLDNNSEFWFRKDKVSNTNTNTGINVNDITNDLDIILSQKSWIKFQSKEFSPLKYLFDGLIETSKKCLCCSTVFKNYEPIITIPLTIPVKNVQDFQQFSIYDCLNHMITEEQLDEENKINCSMCGLKNKGHSKMLFWKTPKILVLHIKRFLTNLYGIPIKKLTNNIIYPVYDLDLSSYFNQSSPFKNSSKYDLVGINIHQSFIGGSINSGHYTSIVKSMYNNNWYLYNDSQTVQQATKMEHLQNNNAYLLFYLRQD